MGYPHFLTNTLEKVKHVLTYNIKRMISILDVTSLLKGPAA